MEYKFKIFENIFSKSECDEILNKCLNESILKTAEVYDNNMMGNIIDVNIRKSKVYGIELKEINEKIISNIKEYFKIKGFEFKISKYQFTQYETGDYFQWHTDSSNTLYKKRFLTIIIQLNDEYEGGEFEIQIDEITHQLKSGIGNLFVFPSSVRHRIKKITKGNRYSIVNWLELEPQKDYKKTLL